MTLAEESKLNFYCGQKVSKNVKIKFLKFIFISFIEGGVDPKSPLGTAAAFSKASKSALILANNSLLFEYASKELLKSLGNK